MFDSPLNRLKLEEDLPHGFSNKKAKGVLPNPLPEQVYLNLGCGKDIREGFINIDIFSDDDRVVFMDIRKLELDDNSVDIILASDVLEHFSHRETMNVLKEWIRVLKPGGEIIIRCPSLKLQAKAYISGAWNADIASYMIFGGQTNPGDYHCVAFDEHSISAKLNSLDCDVLEIREEDYPQDKGFINLNMTIKARKKEIVEDFYTSFNSNALEKSIFDFSDLSQTSDYSEVQPEAIEDIKYEQFETEDDNEFDASLLNEIINFNHFIDSKSKPQLNIVWEGSQFVYHSLALINREHCSNIIDSAAANLTIIPYENDTFSATDNPKYLKLMEQDIRFKSDVDDDIAKLPYVWIRHQWPPKSDPPKGAKWIVMQPWEYSQIPVDFLRIFESCFEVWTPSNYSRNCFIESGVDPNKIQVIPNGINPELFTPQGEKYQLGTTKKFKFLFVGGTIYRKGFDILLNAYTKTFKSTDSVALVVKDMGGNSFYKGQTAKEIIEKHKLNALAPEIIYIDQDLSEEEIASLYRACDVFVSPYRGEGFSLPTLEAMASGLPVIVTDSGATDDFVDSFCAWKISAEKKYLGNEMDGKPLTGNAYVLEPNEDELSAILKHIVANPSSVYKSGKIASYIARKHWTWRRATIKALMRLDFIFGTDMAKRLEQSTVDFEDDYLKYCEAEYLYHNHNFADAKQIYIDSLSSSNLKKRDFNHIYNRLTEIALDDNDILKAHEYNKKALDINPINPDNVFMQAHLQGLKGNYIEALELITNVIDLWTNQKNYTSLAISLDDIFVYSGNLMLKDEDYDGAIQFFQAALKINTNNDEACYGAGLCFKISGYLEEAREMFEWASKLNPNHELAIDELNQL